MFLWGAATFSSFSAAKYGRKQTATVISPKDIGACFTVECGDYHTFSVSDRWLVFANFAKWKQGVTPTSAAVDFNTNK